MTCVHVHVLTDLKDDRNEELIRSTQHMILLMGSDTQELMEGEREGGEREGGREREREGGREREREREGEREGGMEGERERERERERRGRKGEG